MITEKEVLDACVGGRHWWFDKNDNDIFSIDIRQVKPGSIKIQPNWSCQPDLIASYSNMPFENNQFGLVVWDIPHKLKFDSGLITQKYGYLGNEWEKTTRNGFLEIWRVLKLGGTLIFKYADLDIKVSTMLNLFPVKPKVGTITKKGVNNTYFFVFYKTNELEVNK